MSINTKMTALADEIRILSGTSDAMGLDAMKNNVADANDVIDEQEDLIAQIASALEGKATGGGSSSSGSEVCTVVVTSNKSPCNLIYQTIENGIACCKTVYKSVPFSNYSIQTIIGSTLVIGQSSLMPAYRTIQVTGEIVSLTGNTTQPAETLGCTYIVNGNGTIKITL